MLLLFEAGTAHAAIAGLPGDRNATLPVPSPATINTVPAQMMQTLRPAILDTADLRKATVAAPDPRELECVAKVIMHEAGNQPRIGQVAVAQVIRARMKSGRFANTACGVVKQRGQFFNIDAHEPSRSNERWETAMEIATDTLSGEGEEVAPGALFFHSAGARMATRVRVAQIADHTFYR